MKNTHSMGLQSIKDTVQKSIQMPLKDTAYVKYIEKALRKNLLPKRTQGKIKGGCVKLDNEN